MKNHTNLIDDISYKTLIRPKPLRIRFDKIDAFITIHNGTSYLILFAPKKYAVTYNKIKYLESHNTH